MQPYRSIGDPFKMYALSVKSLGEEKSYNDFLKKHGFNSISEFSQKADILIKAYKILKLNLNAAIEINHARYTKQTKELQESDFGTPDIDVTDMYIRLHQAKSGDIYFVKKNLEQLSNVFKTNFIDKGLMILVD